MNNTFESLAKTEKAMNDMRQKMKDDLIAEVRLTEYLKYYIGSLCIITDKQDGKIFQPEVLTYSILTQLDRYSITLILRDLSSMTEQESKELLDVKGGTNVYNLGGIFWSFDSDRFHWAIKRSFDLFRLIEQGIAIKSKVVINNYIGEMDLTEWVNIGCNFK